MDCLRIVVTGLIGSIPLAGLTLHYLQYVLGLRELGHEVLYLEDTGTWYYDPQTDAMVDNNSLPVTYLKETMDAYGLSDSWTFVDHQGESFGVTGSKFRDFLTTADVLVHVTGAMFLRDYYLKIPRRAYIDTDPGYIQLRIAGGSERDLEHLKLHTIHFTFGCNLGASDCLIPTAGVDWHSTVQPVCLALWPIAPIPPADAPYTTILKWQTYRAVEYEGEVYGMKDVEFMKFLSLPQMMDQSLELAMVGRPPVDELEALGWRCRSGLEISSSLESYRQYIQGSRGEWSIAKNGYVRTHSGWFSDRSATYLASGRPVILQATGFERWLPTGEGLFQFSEPKDVLAAFEAINGDYERHCLAARELAETFFDSSKVLVKLLDVAMASTPG
jgi:hypothetical protein